METHVMLCLRWSAYFNSAGFVLYLMGNQHVHRAAPMCKVVHRSLLKRFLAFLTLETHVTLCLKWRAYFNSMGSALYLMDDQTAHRAAPVCGIAHR
jgi:hypothetical protein